MQEFEEFIYDEEEEEEVSVGLPRWAEWTLALLAVLGMLYISGIYQGLFFRQTSPEVRQEPAEQIVAGEELVLPLSIIVLTGDEIYGSLRSQDSVDALITNAEAIWNQANISFRISKETSIDLSDQEVQEVLNAPRRHIPDLAGYNPDTVTVVLVRTLAGINGIAFGGAESVAVADYTTSHDFRTLAHEIGHILGLGHTSEQRRLMTQGTAGTELTEEEVLTAREHARAIIEASP